MAEAPMPRAVEAMAPTFLSGSMDWIPARSMATDYAMCGTGSAEDASDQTAPTDTSADSATAQTMAQQPAASDRSADCQPQERVGGSVSRKRDFGSRLSL